MNQKILPPRSKPYFPMILANGSDVILLDYSGSMHCQSGHLHMEQHQGMLCGWQKVSHRKVGRHMLSVAYFPYRVMRPDDDVYEVGYFDQTFDPYTATLTTEAHTGILHLRITAFLVDGQPLYVERFEVLWVDPEAKPKIAFLGGQMADPRIAQVSFAPGGNAKCAGDYTLEETTGSLRMAVDAHGKAVVDRTSAASGHLEVRDLQPGDVIDRFVTMQDTSHLGKPIGEIVPASECDPPKACEETIREALAKGFDGLHDEHSRVWRDYHANTQISLPDSDLEYEYRLSLYLLRAAQHPSGFVTHGVYNVLWGGGSCCAIDLIANVRAWASCNQLESIKALLDYYDKGAGVMARKYGRQIGKPGLNYPWMFDVFGRDVYHKDAVAAEAAGTQRGGIASMATQSFDAYRYFGDMGDLRKRLPAMREMIDFITAEIIVQDGDKWNTRALMGADENIDRVNDSGHLMRLIRAMKDYQQGCRALGMPEDPGYAAAIEGLSIPVRENYRDGVLYPWKGARDVISTNAGSYNEEMPEGIDPRSIRASFRCKPGEWGLVADNAGRDPSLIWPAHESCTAIAFSSVDPRFAFRRMMRSLRFVDYHGFYPEKIRPDGFWINIGYTTCHAHLVWAVNSLLATDNVKKLTIAAGLPISWQDYSFENIHTPSGYSVSLEMKQGRVKRLVIENTRPETRKIRLRLLSGKHQDARDEMVTLVAGRNVIV